jgi:hypothetical protein
MRRPPSRDDKQSLTSERGFLELTERRTGIPPAEALSTFRDLVSADMDWADSRKVYFRRRASWSKWLSLGLTALSTVVLGIQQIPYNASIALPMVATVTLLGALELFHNWRSRWILMEEAQYEFNRLRDEIDYRLVTREEITSEQVDRFFADQQRIWADVSRRWVEFRRLGDAQQAGPPTARHVTP